MTTNKPSEAELREVMDKMREKIRAILIDPNRLEFGETKVNLRVGATVDRIAVIFLDQLTTHTNTVVARTIDSIRSELPKSKPYGKTCNSEYEEQWVDGFNASLGQVNLILDKKERI